MKKSFLIFVMFFVWNLFSAQKNFLDQPYIEVSASVDTLVVPDRIYVSITLNEADSKNKKSVEEQEKQLETILKKLKINTDKDLSVLGYSSDFKKYFLKGQSILKTKKFSLLVRDAYTLGNVLISLEEAGISNTEVEKVEYSKSKELLLELKSEAVKRSRITADKLVKPLNQKAGKALYISDTNYGGIEDYEYATVGNIALQEMDYKKESASEEFLRKLDFQKIKFSTTVYVKYQLD
ncbi:MAG: SIMPL domain-containing protein [Flavobacteriaceae bacterium]|nr:SIMPL domain-containing protein [Flavobacteriaceae bacterium]